jgi:hypothetical protein
VRLDRPVTLLAGENGSEGSSRCLRLSRVPRPPARSSSLRLIRRSCSPARVYELDGSSVTTPDYDDLRAVSLTRGFLAAPERYLRALDSDALEEDR